jgi:hypothetical protein
VAQEWAVNKSERFSQMDRAAGLAPPEECAEPLFLKTLREAAECGLKSNIPGRKHEILEDIRDMINLRLPLIEENRTP